LAVFAVVFVIQLNQTMQELLESNIC